MEIQTQSRSSQKKALSVQLTPAQCLGVFPNPAGGWVSLWKGNWDFFGSKRRCITLEHRIQLFHSLNKSSDCRSDISDSTWPHCERKMHPPLPRSVFNTGMQEKALRNVLLCSPGLDASVLQSDLDVPLVPVPLAAFHALCCQLYSHVQCYPALGSLDVSLGAGEWCLVPQGWCLGSESWKTHTDNTPVLSQMSLTTSSVVRYTEQLQWLVTSAELDQCPSSTLYAGDNLHLPSFTYSFLWPEHSWFHIAEAIRTIQSCPVFCQSWLHFCVRVRYALKHSHVHNCTWRMLHQNV